MNSVNATQGGTKNAVTGLRINTGWCNKSNHRHWVKNGSEYFRKVLQQRIQGVVEYPTAA